MCAILEKAFAAAIWLTRGPQQAHSLRQRAKLGTNGYAGGHYVDIHGGCVECVFAAMDRPRPSALHSSSHPVAAIIRKNGGALHAVSLEEDPSQLGTLSMQDP